MANVACKDGTAGSRSCVDEPELAELLYDQKRHPLQCQEQLSFRSKAFGFIGLAVVTSAERS
jgi:hypothetical protein